MSLAAHGAHEFTTRARSAELHALRVKAAHSAKTLLMQGLRMILVLAFFTALVAAVIGIRLLAFLPALHHG